MRFRYLLDLKLNAETGVILAAAGLEANYSVTLKWVKEKEAVRLKPKTKK